MRMIQRTFWAAVCLFGFMVQAQETNTVQMLQQQLEQLRHDFERTLEQQRKQIEALRQQIQALQSTSTIETTRPPVLQSERGTIPEGAGAMKRPWSPASPLTLLGGERSYLNVSFDALFAAGTSTADDIGHLQLGGHDPVQRGFTAQNLETVFTGNVDPYFRGQASLVGHIGSDGDFHFEAEEVYAETLGLPRNLQVRAGQFLTEFGRSNPTHPHTWNFVDVPLVNGRFFGPEGLRNPGARLSWLIPTPFYSELLFAVQNSQGGTAHSFRGTGGHSHDHAHAASLFGRELVDDGVDHAGDMLYSARYAASVDLTETQTTLAGASVAIGPNNSGTSGDTDTVIFGVDLFWKWKPATHHGGFPFVSWQTEVMARRYDAGVFAEDEDGDGLLDLDLPEETLWDYGFYSELAWGFRKSWVAALRGDFVTGERGAFYPDPNRDERWRISPSLTYYPSEFSKLRLQYNYDDRENVGEDHSVWLQFEFMLGTHAAHKF